MPQLPNQTAGDQPVDIFADIEPAASAAPSPNSSAIGAAPAPSGDQPITMKAAAGPSAGKKAAVVILMIVFIAIIAGVGYFIYTRYIAAPAPASPSPIVPESPAAPTIEPEITTPAVLPLATTEQAATTETELTPTAVDTDNDRLTDSEERTLGTDIEAIDTDNDGLTDYEEVKIYKTDPLDPDSDDDGYKDGEEVAGGYDPNNATKGARLPGIPVEPNVIE
ncbi:MAG: hypothetical protein ACOZBH_01495 [Patescibacteria group bacterium]